MKRLRASPRFAPCKSSRNKRLQICSNEMNGLQTNKDKPHGMNGFGTYRKRGEGVPEPWVPVFAKLRRGSPQHVAHLHRKGTQRLAAMTEPMFRSQIDLSHGFVQGREIKERIVAEATIPLRCSQDFPFNLTFGGEQTRPIPSSSQNAPVATAAPTPWNALQALQ